MIIVFAYHSISDKNYKYATTPENFRWQLIQVKKRFKIIKLDELDEILKEEKPLKNNYAVITFDDGVEDNYLNAFPILSEMNIPASIFITTGLINKDITNSSGLRFHFLNLDQIKEMHNSGLIDFQAHTHTHPNLTEIDRNKMKVEFKESENILKEVLNKEVNYFAYPKGLYNKIAKKYVGKEYKLGFAKSGVILNKKYLDKYLLPRITIYNDLSKIKFLLFLNPLLWRLHNLIKF